MGTHTLGRNHIIVISAIFPPKILNSYAIPYTHWGEAMQMQPMRKVFLQYIKASREAHN